MPETGIEDKKLMPEGGGALPKLPSLSQDALSGQIADAIVEGIATGVFPPDARLVETDICDRLEVSRIPVREALKMLEAQGVTVSLPRRGYRVAAIDPKRIMEIHEVRVALELIAARDAARQCAADPDSAAHLEEIVADMGKRIHLDDWSGPNSLDIAYHREMCRISQNFIVATLWEAIARHIRIIFGFSVIVDSDPEFLYNEHRVLTEKLKSGDVDAVEAELRAHLREPRLTP